MARRGMSAGEFKKPKLCATFNEQHTWGHTHTHTHISTSAYLKVICTHIYTLTQKHAHSHMNVLYPFEKDFASVLICPLFCCCFSFFFSFFAFLFCFFFSFLLKINRLEMQLSPSCLSSKRQRSISILNAGFALMVGIPFGSQAYTHTLTYAYTWLQRICGQLNSK